MSDHLCTITLRDGRVGRDPALVTHEGGEILKRYGADSPVDVGDHVSLDDGTEVVVIGVSESLGSEWTIEATIGSL